jgi:hypothetical protein
MPFKNSAIYNQIGMIRAVKIGFWTMIGGVLSIIVVFAQGVGPCGPKSAVGALILLGGMVAAVFGFLTAVIALAWNSLRRRTGNS